MIELLKAKNPEIEFCDVREAEFSKYGRVIENLDLGEIQKAGEKIPYPQEGTTYLPSVEEFETLAIAKTIQNEFFGTLPTQVGYCFGYSNFMNATEWHFSNEINIALTDQILFLATLSDLENGKIPSSKFKAFYFPRGTVIEVYSTTLHFCPCQVSDAGFGCVVALPKGTNIPLEVEVEDPVLFRRNKWILAHEENRALIEKGVVSGITGTNYQIKY
ncbi:MAG: DUF4867 family protein [Clostridia bacterium]|nr:DUF4867 family protein [Clostridia bacterium]